MLYKKICLEVNFMHGHLTESQRLEIKSCPPKGDKPREFFNSWRPFTVLNVFSKLISGCISYKIKSTLDYTNRFHTG